MMFTSKVRRNVFFKKEKRAGCNIDVDDDDDDDDKDNCFCGMVDRRKAFSLISSWCDFRDPHHRKSPTHHKQDLKPRRT